jgi:hypothetical protein
VAVGDPARQAKTPFVGLVPVAKNGNEQDQCDDRLDSNIRNDQGDCDLVMQ